MENTPHNDCYFYTCKIKGFNKKNKKDITYPNISSVMRPVPHGPGIPVTVRPENMENIPYEFQAILEELKTIAAYIMMTEIIPNFSPSLS